MMTGLRKKYANAIAFGMNELLEIGVDTVLSHPGRKLRGWNGAPTLMALSASEKAYPGEA